MTTNTTVPISITPSKHVDNSIHQEYDSIIGPEIHLNLIVIHKVLEIPYL